MKGHNGMAIPSDFEKTALPHLSHLYTAAYYLAKDKTEAEDLVQETYLRAFRFFAKFQPGTSCRAWLLSILRRLFINRYWQRKREPQMVDWEKIDETYESMVETADPESLLFSKVTNQEVQDALKELPEDYRIAIVLVDIQDLSYQEAASVMSCPIGTVRSRVSRGRRMLEVALRHHVIDRLM